MDAGSACFDIREPETKLVDVDGLHFSFKTLVSLRATVVEV